MRVSTASLACSAWTITSRAGPASCDDCSLGEAQVCARAIGALAGRPRRAWRPCVVDARWFTNAGVVLVLRVDRGLDPEQAILFVIDGGKALRRAINDVFGERALVHRCHRHKQRNVCDLLPERDRDQVRARIRAAWALTDAQLAHHRSRCRPV
jgi:Transposase, Mutator family